MVRFVARTTFTSRIVHVGAGMTATAVRGSNVQRRSAPSSHGGDFSQAGFEFVDGLDLVGRAPEIGEEAVALLDAPVCPTGPTTLVLGSDQLALQVHESVGHAVELDRIFGLRSRLRGHELGGSGEDGVLRYGSDLMNVVADATEPGGLGTFGWDARGRHRAADAHRPSGSARRHALRRGNRRLSSGSSAPVGTARRPAATARRSFG